MLCGSCFPYLRPFGSLASAARLTAARANRNPRSSLRAIVRTYQTARITHEAVLDGGEPATPEAPSAMTSYLA